MNDQKFMNDAIKEAKKTLDDGNLPVGAILVIDGKYVGGDCNRQMSNNNWISHAEKRLMETHSALIKKSKKEGKQITLYTTLEPCLMCLGTIVLHRINRVVYACPDPCGGAASLDSKRLTSWYERKWPGIEGPFNPKESYNLIIEYIKGKADWEKIYDEFLDKIKV